MYINHLLDAVPCWCCRCPTQSVCHPEMRSHTVCEINTELLSKQGWKKQVREATESMCSTENRSQHMCSVRTNLLHLKKANHPHAC